MASDPSSLGRLRQTPLEAILAHHGLQPRREGSTTRYKNEQFNIVVGGGALWFDNAASVGGRGPIDLVLHLRAGVAPRNASKRDLVEAIHWLVSFEPGPLAAGLAAPPLPKAREPFESQAQRLAIRDDVRWPLVRSYLVETRGLPGELVDAFHRRGDIYASHSVEYPARTGACFVHRDVAGEIRGATIRPAEAGPGSPFSIGEKQRAWFTVGDIDKASQLVVTEGPIDALSYIAMRPTREIVVLAMSSAHVFQPVLQLAHEKVMGLAVGFDNDLAGEAGWERCQKNHADLYPEGIPPRRIVPVGKDWNDELRFGHQRSAGRHP